MSQEELVPIHKATLEGVNAALDSMILLLGMLEHRTRHELETISATTKLAENARMLIGQTLADYDPKKSGSITAVK
jgi:hypothetical protein